MAIPLAVIPAIPSGSVAAIKAILRPVAQDQIRPHTTSAVDLFHARLMSIAQGEVQWSCVRSISWDMKKKQT